MKEISRLFKHYSLIEIFRLIRDIILTKISYPSNVRIVRQPAYMVGKKNISFGKNFSSGVNLRIEILSEDFLRHPVKGFRGNPELIIGDNVNINNNVHIGVIQRITIGNDVLVGSNVLIIDHNHGNYKGMNQDAPEIPPKVRQFIPEVVSIGNNVWISENVCILPGSHIGDGCIIGANSIVSGSFGINRMIAGSPAKVIKTYDVNTRSWIKA